MDKNNLPFTSAHKLEKLIRKKEISPLELTELYLQRIDDMDAQWGSFAHVAHDSAIKDAHVKTEILGNTKDTQELPTFFGIPTAIKDLYSVKGMPTAYGNGFIKDNIADFDSGIVTKIKEAGMIILGKTATSELGSLPYIESPSVPPCRNPYNPKYTAGGSSGGAAAAVAGGLIPVVHGSDGGGSVRGPAFCCGLVGLKPSRGRISSAPVGDYLAGMATQGCLSRSVMDSAMLLDILSGYVMGDPYWLDNPSEGFASLVTKNPPSLKIAFATEILPFGKADDCLQKQVKDAVDIFADMGHKLTEGCPDFSSIVEPFKVIWQGSMVQGDFPDAILSPMNLWLRKTAPSLREYLNAVHQIQVISRQIVAFFADFDVLILPTYLQPPIKVGEWASLSSEVTLDHIINWIAPCPPFNATGQPAIALPTGFTDSGLPIGIQIVGKPKDETTILQLAYQLEQIKQWQKHRPSSID
ncbi:amidase [Cyanobacterium sp. HL-69]|uniref:amidase n=1 Tax=Cyanobacterium sp. HL-69 TaxID=2054282 RepID=UPI00406BB6BF